MRFGLKGRNVELRPLTAGDREQMIAFAEALPEEDLLFLDRDITQPEEMDEWISEAQAGRLVTLFAWERDRIVGYATSNLGRTRWTRHVSELRVAVSHATRGLGIGRLLLELAFEMVLEQGATKVIARMTPEQPGALKLFQRLGFAEEAVLRDHAMDRNGRTHDLLVLSFHTRAHQADRCEDCGIPVLEALVLAGVRLCSNCYETRYGELGSG